MKFTAKTKTLRQVVEILDKNGVEEVEGFIPNDAQDIGETLLELAKDMEQDEAALKAGKEQAREQSRQRSQGKAFKNPP